MGYRWSGAKARCGYYGMDSSPPESFYNPEDPENPSEIFDDFTVSLIGVSLLFFWPIVPLGVLLSPVFLFAFFIKKMKINRMIKRFSSIFSFNTKYAIWKGKKLRFAIDANYIFSSDQPFAAEKIIKSLNERKYGGLSNWRIPYEREIVELREIGKEACHYIYNETDKSLSFVTILNKSGFLNVRSLDYIANYDCESLEYEKSSQSSHVVYLNLHRMPSFSFTSYENTIALWPVSDIVYDQPSVAQ